MPVEADKIRQGCVLAVVRRPHCFLVVSRSFSSAGVREDGGERVARLYEEHAPAILRRARRRSPHLAEDVVAETFAVAVRRADVIPEGRELAWLFVVADHTLQNMMRSQRRAGRLIDAIAPLIPVAADPVQPPVIGDALAQLSERERSLLVLTAFEGLSAGEAADRLGISYGSARNGLVQGRRRLAASLTAMTALIFAFGVYHWVSSRPQDAPTRLKASIQQAGAIHQVAIVRRRGYPASRYERWSSPSGNRQRVLLPGGRTLTATGGETLLHAAISATKHGTTYSRRVRQDLTALDVSSPAALSKLVASKSPATRRKPGPFIDGQATTLVAGQVSVAGIGRDVVALVANRSADVLRVRARPLSAGRVTEAQAIVDFIEWTAVPPGAQANAGLNQTPAVRPTPTTAGVAPHAASAVPRSTPAPSHNTTARSFLTHAPLQTQRATRLPAATAAITHLQETITQCDKAPSSQSNCFPQGVADLYFERGGKHRVREVRRRQPGGPILSDGWIAKHQLLSYRTSKTGSVRGSIQTTGLRHLDDPLSQWHGGWFQEIWPTVRHVQIGAAGILQPGPDINGRPTTQTTVSLSSQPPSKWTWTGTLLFDAQTKSPARLTALATAPPQYGLGSQVTMSYVVDINAIEVIPPGRQETLLTGTFPAATHFADRN